MIYVTIRSLTASWPIFVFEVVSRMYSKAIVNRREESHFCNRALFTLENAYLARYKLAHRKRLKEPIQRLDITGLCQLTYLRTKRKKDFINECGAM